MLYLKNEKKNNLHNKTPTTVIKKSKKTHSIFTKINRTEIIHRDHSFSTFGKFSVKSNISYSLIHTRTCAYQGVRIDTFSKNFFERTKRMIPWKHSLAVALGNTPQQAKVCTKSQEERYPVDDTYLFKASNGNTRTICETCS